MSVNPKNYYDMSPAQINGLPSGKQVVFDYQAQLQTKPREKKQATLAGTFNFYQNNGGLGSTDAYPELTSKNTIINRRKELEELIKLLDAKQVQNQSMQEQIREKYNLEQQRNQMNHSMEIGVDAMLQSQPIS